MFERTMTMPGVQGLRLALAGILCAVGLTAQAADLPALAAGKELLPGWKEKVQLADDAAAQSGKALVLALTTETGKETSKAYWNYTLNGQLTRAPVVTLAPFHRYRAWVRLRVKPNVGSSSSIVLYMSTDGTDYNPNVTWRNVAHYYGFQFAQANVYQELSADFVTGEKGTVIPEVRVINMGPEPDGFKMGTGELTEIALDSIRFEDLTPELAVTQVRTDKGNYRRHEPKSAMIAVRNFGTTPRRAELRVTLHADLADVESLLRRDIELQPGQEQRFDMPIKTTAEFGYELRAELVADGKPLDARSDIFTVADNVYKIQMVTSKGPSAPSAFCWSGAVDMRRVPELVEAGRAGYGNFYEFFAWPPDDGLDFVPKGDKWWAGQNGYPGSKSNLKGIIAELHKHGIKAIFYAAWWSNGTGIETFRKHPDWFLYDDDTGRGGGCDIEAYKQAKKLIAEGKEGEGLQKSGGGAAPNWADPRVVDAGLDSMRESIRMFGWDGVRWDGEYQMTYLWDKMDIHGRKVKDLYKDMDETNTRILRQIIERFRREEPQFVWGYNNEMNPRMWGTNPPKAQAYKLKQGGSLMWESPRTANEAMNPNHTFGEYSTNTCEMADYCRERGGYFMQFPAGAGWVGTVHDRIYKTIIPVVAGSTVYGNSAWLGDSIGQYNKFIARYCSLWWDDKVRSVHQPERFLKVEGSGPIWWKDYVDARPAGWGKRDLIIHLVNEPVNKVIGPEVTGRMPAIQTNVRVALDRQAGGRVQQAWWLSPEPDAVCQPVDVVREGAADTVVVPRLQCWSVVVLRVAGAKW